MSLESGKRIHAKKWIELPIDDIVIDRVTAMATKQQQPIMPDNYPIFEWAQGLVLDTPPLNLDEDWQDLLPNEDMVIDPMYEPDQNHNVISDDEGSEAIVDDDETGQIDKSQLDVIQDNVVIDDANDSISANRHDILNDDTVDNSSNSCIESFIEENIVNDREDDNSVELDDNSGNRPINDDDSNDDGVSDSGSVHSSDFSFNIANDDDSSTDDCDGVCVNNNEPIMDNALDVVSHETSDDVPEVPNDIAVSRPWRENAGAGVERLEMGFGGKEYASVQHRQLILKRSLHVLLTQMSANEGIQRFGERAVAAMIKELK